MRSLHEEEEVGQLKRLEWCGSHSQSKEIIVLDVLAVLVELADFSVSTDFAEMIGMDLGISQEGDQSLGS